MLYAVREYACTAIDIIARRTRLAFCNVHAAEEALPRIIQIMAGELKWSKQKQEVNEPRREKKRYSGILTRSDTNRAAQPLEMIRGLKFQI